MIQCCQLGSYMDLGKTDGRRIATVHANGKRSDARGMRSMQATEPVKGSETSLPYCEVESLATDALRHRFVVS
jgi:hypothetical protein